MDDDDKTKEQILKELFEVLPRLNRDDLGFLHYDAMIALESIRKKK